MKRYLVAAFLLGALAPHAPRAQVPAELLDEDAIVAEVEALQDSTPEADEKTRAKVRELLHKGVAAHDAHKYDKALKSYQEALELDPLSDTAYYEIALTYNAQGSLREALDAVVRAIALNPKSEMFRVLQASLLDDLGHREAAVASYRKLLEIQPDSYMGHLNLGLTLTRMERWDESEAAYEKAIEIDPDYPSAYFHLSRLCNTLGYNYDEEKYLNRFLEVGESDHRAEVARERLEELRTYNVTIDQDNPYADIELLEKLTRATWRTELHRLRYPEARGYQLTFAEDKDAFQDVVTAWRERKAQDPQAAYGEYDLLLRIDDAGYLDEYIWYHRQNLLGAPASEWIAEHPDRIAAFLEWARNEGLLAEEEGEPARTARDRVRDLPGELFEIMEASDIKYEMRDVGEDRTALLEAEARRFSAGLKLKGTSRVRCGKVERNLDEAIRTAGAWALLDGLRCFLPGDAGYEFTHSRALTLGLVLHEVEFAPEGEIRAAEGVEIAVSPGWLFYTVAKAGWRFEPSIRELHRGGEGTEPQLAEEIYAVAVAAGGYANLLEAAEEREPGDDQTQEPERLPALDRLLEAVDAGYLRGYVLYEVIHKAYGIPLDELSEGDAKALSSYLYGMVIRRTQAEPPE